MKKSIIKVTTCAFIISAITLFYTHQDVCAMKLSRITSFYRGEDEPTEQDNDGGSTVDYFNVFANNDNQYLYGREDNHSEAAVTTNNYADAKTDVGTENFIPSNTNSTSDAITYSEKVSTNANEFGPNNNDQDVAFGDFPNGEVTTSNQPEEIKHPLSSSPTDNPNETPKEFNPVIISRGAPAPPGGGEDPFSVPFDDFYGLVLLLIASAIFGVLKAKKVV